MGGDSWQMGHSDSHNDHVQLSSGQKDGAFREVETHLWMPGKVSTPQDEIQN